MVRARCLVLPEFDKRVAGKIASSSRKTGSSFNRQPQEGDGTKSFETRFESREVTL